MGGTGGTEGKPDAGWLPSVPGLPGWRGGPAALALAIERRWRDSQRTWLLGLAVVVAALLVTAGQLDRILIDVGYPLPSGGGMTKLHEADSVGSWSSAAEGAGLRDDPRAIAIVYLALDLPLILAYTTLLALVALRLRAMLRKSEEGDNWFEPLKFVLTATLVLTLPLACVDLLENLAQALLLARLDLGAAAILPYLTFAKWALLALVAFGPAIAVARLVRDRWSRKTRGVLRTIAVLRFQVLAVALFALLLFAPVATQQSADAILRWGVSDGWEIVVAGVALTLLLSTALFVTARNSAYAEESRERGPLPAPALLALGALLLGAAAAVGVFGDREGAGLAVLGGVLIAIAGLSLPNAVKDGATAHTSPQAAGKRRATSLLPALLAAAPPLMLGLAILAATTGQLALGLDDQAPWAGVTAIGVVLLVVAAAIFHLALGAGKKAGKVGSGGMIVAGVATLVLTVAIYLSPLDAPLLAGAIGVVAAFLIAIAIAGWVMATLERKWGPPAALALLGFHRMPALTLVVVAAIATMTIDDTGDHAIRTTSAETAAKLRPPVTAGKALDRWELRNEPTGRTVTPLVFVAASGGGIRAAYWTARVLRCAFERQGPPAACDGKPGRAPDNRLGQAIFLASGVSGGSLGLASYAARLETTGDPAAAVASEGAPATGDDWVRDRLGDDYLTPTVAWMLFADVPKAITGLRLWDDRATVLERAWERSWSDDPPPGGGEALTAGLRETWRSNRAAPLLVLNGTDVSRACRVSTSVLDADVEDRDEVQDGVRVTADCHSQSSFTDGGTDDEDRSDWALPATHDLIDHLECDPDNPLDVRLSTAALLSARFPFVSPSGRVALCPKAEPIDVVDGGYVENSGASTALEIWQHLRARVERFNSTHERNCIAPVFVQIDNDYVRDREPGLAEQPRPIEPLVPPRVFTRVRHGNAANARQAAALAFGPSGFGDVEALRLDGQAVGRYVQLFPRFHAGTKAPLGWVLSKPSMESLDAQLATQPRAEAGLATIRKWFDPGLACDKDVTPAEDRASRM